MPEVECAVGTDDFQLPGTFPALTSSSPYPGKVKAALCPQLCAPEVTLLWLSPLCSWPWGPNIGTRSFSQIPCSPTPALACGSSDSSCKHQSLQRAGLTEQKKEKGKKPNKNQREMERKTTPSSLFPPLPLICYCRGSSWPDLTCKQWSPVNHQRPFTSPAAAGRVPVSTAITLTPPEPTAPTEHCPGPCFRDHLQCFGSKERLFFPHSLTQGDIYLKTWLQQPVHALRIT